MTLIIARQFGKRIIIASDTMITDSKTDEINALPGRLKAIVIAPHISVAYAGYAGPGLIAARDAKQCVDGGGDVADVEDVLRAWSEKHPDRLDFVLASHRPDACLTKIWSGRISRHLCHAVLGAPALAKPVLGFEDAAPLPFVPDDQEEEMKFQHGFAQLFFERGVHVTRNVGGVPIFLLASPWGHRYKHHWGSIDWDPVMLDQAILREQIARPQGGMTSWGYEIQAQQRRGLALAGVRIEQAGVGFIHTPLTDDDPVKWTASSSALAASDASEFYEALVARAKTMEGGIDDLSPSESRDPPSPDDLQKIQTLAAFTKYPTTISAEKTGLRLTMMAAVVAGQPPGPLSTLADYARLNPDPVDIVARTLERMTEYFDRERGKSGRTAIVSPNVPG